MNGINSEKAITVEPGVLTFSPKSRQSPDALYLDSLDFIQNMHSEYQHKAKSFRITYDFGPKDTTATFNMYLDLIWAAYVNKTSLLLDSFITSVNSENYVTFALIGRSIIENTAILRYYLKTDIQPLAAQCAAAGKSGNDRLKKDVILKLDRLLHGGRFKWDSLATGRIEDVLHGDSTFLPQVSIGKCIFSWAKDDQPYRSLYDLYSDMTHPNLGSNLLVLKVWGEQPGFGGDDGYIYGRMLMPLMITGISQVIKELHNLLNTLLLLHI